MQYWRPMVNRQPFFHRNIVYAMLSKYVWDNIAQENYLCNIGLERTDMFFQENKLRNVVLVCLSQHCIKQLRTQCTKCWPTVHSLVSVVQIWLKQHWTKKLLVQYWPSSDSHLFVENSVVLICLSQTLPKKITCAMLAHSPQTTLDRKIILNFV